MVASYGFLHKHNYVFLLFLNSFIRSDNFQFYIVWDTVTNHKINITFKYMCPGPDNSDCNASFIM
jgi:hypothetical protein